MLPLEKIGSPRLKEFQRIHQHDVVPLPTRSETMNPNATDERGGGIQSGPGLVVIAGASTVGIEWLMLPLMRENAWRPPEYNDKSIMNGNK